MSVLFYRNWSIYALNYNMSIDRQVITHLPSTINKQCIKEVWRWITTLSFFEETVGGILSSDSTLFDDGIICFRAVISSTLFHRSLCHNKFISITRSLSKTCPDWPKKGTQTSESIILWNMSKEVVTNIIMNELY